MQYTENYFFPKPDYEDFVDIQDLNRAFDGIDGQLASQEKHLNSTTDSLQSLEKIKTQMKMINDKTDENGDHIVTIISDIAKLSFQLSLQSLIDSSEMRHVIIDEIDSQDAVIVVSGKYGNNRVYI